ALLPFEPPYMEAAGMTCDFVGHPIAQRPSPTRGEVLAARRRWGLEEGTPTLLVAPGSRKSEVARLAPLFREVVTRAKAKIGGLRVLVPVAETVAPEVRSALADFPGDPVLIRPDWGEPAKLAAFAVADAALLASGTVTLEMAAARTPMVACYKTSWLTAAIVRRIVKVRTANLVNLVSGETPVPEFLQEYATPEVVSDALIPLLTDWTAAEPQLMAFEKVLGQLGSDGEAPEDRAAASILRKIGLASPQEEPTPPPFIPRSRGSG
ncbi:MAG: lipid-A-disaccharide synthase, partial [Pseudomonadota bacterium]